MYFWSFVVAILIFAVGAGISIYEGIRHLLHPEPLRNPVINYGVLGLALVFEGGAWYFAFRAFNRARDGWGYLEAVRRGKDPTLFVVPFEDSAAMAGLLVALAGVLLADLTGLMVFDGVNEVLTMHMGPEFVLLNVSVAFRPEASAGELEAAVAALDARIKAAYPEVKRIFVEAEPRRAETAP